MLEGDELPITASRLAKMTGQTEGQIGLQLNKLEEIELIERTQIRNRQGRGRAFQLSIKHTPKTKRLARRHRQGDREEEAVIWIS